MDAEAVESQIHHFEKKAWFAVRRAFMARADIITWKMFEFLSGLRQELRISDCEYTEIMSRLNADEAIKWIRERRGSIRDSTAVVIPSHNIAGKRKRPRQDIPRPDVLVGANTSEIPDDRTGNKLPEDIEIFNTASIMKEVERILSSSNPDPAEVELAKKKLEEQEQALMDAISVLSTVLNRYRFLKPDEEPFT